MISSCFDLYLEQLLSGRTFRNKEKKVEISLSDLSQASLNVESKICLLVGYTIFENDDSCIFDK